MKLSRFCKEVITKVGKILEDKLKTIFSICNCPVGLKKKVSLAFYFETASKKDLWEDPSSANEAAEDSPPEESYSEYESV